MAIQIQPMSTSDEGILDGIIASRDWLLKNCKERLPEVDCDAIFGTEVFPIEGAKSLAWYWYFIAGLIAGKVIL